MKNSEKYTSWNPLDETPPRVQVGSLYDDERGLTVLLDNGYDAPASMLISVSFDAYIAYRNMDESYRAKTFAAHSVPFDRSLYIVENSSWIRWFHEESMGIYKERNIIHYSIITNADCIDVLSEFAPIVNWRKRGAVTLFQR